MTTKITRRALLGAAGAGYLKGTKITDEEFDQIALDPIPEFGTWNYIIRGFKHDED